MGRTTGPRPTIRATHRIFPGFQGFQGFNPITAGLPAATPEKFPGLQGLQTTRRARFPAQLSGPPSAFSTTGKKHGGTKFRPGVWYFGTDKAGELTAGLDLFAAARRGRDLRRARQQFRPPAAVQQHAREAGASGRCRWSCCGRRATSCAASCWRWAWRSTRRRRRGPAGDYLQAKPPQAADALRPCKSAGAAIPLCCRTP